MNQLLATNSATQQGGEDTSADNDNDNDNHNDHDSAVSDGHARRPPYTKPFSPDNNKARRDRNRQGKTR